MKAKLLRILQNKWFLAAGCLVLGAAIILGIRFATYHPADEVHYHANFALYINGQRELFKGSRYYEETEMCTANKTVTVDERAHMHDNINDVVHVEDHAVTWGQFFTNLGWTLGPNFIQAPGDVLYVASGDQKLHIILNGQDYTDLGSIANNVIKDQDRLLVSFGNETNADLITQFASVPRTAHTYDVTPDPKSCSGHSDSTLRDRMMHLL